VNRLRLLSLLTAAAVILSTVVAIELWSGTGGASDTAGVAALDREGRGAPPAALSQTPKDAPRLTAQILARPLFALNRRPEATAAAETSELIVSDLPRLAGIVTIMNVKFAIFQPHNGGKPIVASVGDTLDGRKIQAIAVDEIVLTGPDGIEHLHPRPDPALEHGSPPVPGRAIRNVPRPGQSRHIILTP
jgi:hypothetical protein